MLYKSCINCGIDFRTFPSILKRGMGKFCSHKCEMIFRHKDKEFGFIKGLTPWNKGLKLPQFSGEKHPGWKGENAKYIAKHNWIANNFGKPDTCEKCKKSGFSGHRIHWANKSGKYFRNFDDWIRLCVSCHRKYDGMDEWGFQKGYTPWNKK